MVAGSVGSLALSTRHVRLYIVRSVQPSLTVVEAYQDLVVFTVNFCIMPKPETLSLDSLDEFERTNVERGMAFVANENAYAKEHASRPATLGLLVSTSPLALLAW